MKGRPYPRELKFAVVRQVASGERRVAEVCQEHGIDERVLRRWRAEYAALGERAFLPRTAVAPAVEGRDGCGQGDYVAELERFCGRLVLENERLRRAVEADCP